MILSSISLQIQINEELSTTYCYVFGALTVLIKVTHFQVGGFEEVNQESLKRKILC